MIPGAKDQALFLYGFDVNGFNNSLPFKNTFGGPEIIAVLNQGNYTATTFMAELKRAMEFIDGVNHYTITLDRTVAGNTDTRMTISTDGSFLSLLFGTGSTGSNSPYVLMGFPLTDQTGFTTYNGSFTSGQILIPDFPMYDYIGPDENKKSDGVKNVSAFGIKETLVFSQMSFFEAQWKYITNQFGNTQKTQWDTFLQYATRQKQLEFTPSLNESATTFYQCTLESTPADSNGMAYKLSLMGQGLFRFYSTGSLKFRVNQE